MNKREPVYISTGGGEITVCPIDTVLVQGWGNK